MSLPPRFLRLAFAAWLIAAPLLAQEDADTEGVKRIRQIRLKRSNVFTEEKADESWLARAANDFHVRTKESVIRTEILFKEGEVLDQDLLDATERNLRRLKFINVANAKVVPVDDETVDVELETTDAWSLVPGLDIRGGGGLTVVSAHLTEANLLGTGKKPFVKTTYESDIGTTWKVGFTDPQMFGSQWIGHVNYQNGPLIESIFASTNLPLYSPDSKWSYSAKVYLAEEIVRLFEEGQESSRFERDRWFGKASAARALGARFKKWTFNLALAYEKAEFESLGDETTAELPPNQENLTPSIGFSKENESWAKPTYLDKMGIIEDTRLGSRFGGSVGYGIPLGDGFDLWDINAYGIYNVRFAEVNLLKLLAIYETEVVRNTLVFADVKYYHKFSGHTFASNLSADFGFDLDASRQFQLGGESGLRGYEARQFTGDRRLLLNLEDRQFWGKLFGGPKLGTVLFVDAGNVWKPDQVVDLSDLNWAAGFGLRLGFSRMPHEPIFRMDFGWAIGQDGFAITLGNEQHF